MFTAPLRVALRAALRAGAAAESLYGGRIEIDGNVLDPELHAVLAGARAVGAPSPESMPVAEARVYAARMLGTFDAAPRPMRRVIDTAAPGPAGPIPVRIYQPTGARPAMIVFLHGGGGVIGSVASYDRMCRLLAAETGCVVASVEYRLAPEAPYPAAIDDAVAAWTWARGRAAELGVDPARIAVAGDSFGGYLAAWVERRTRGSALAPRLSVLIYPVVDFTYSSASYVTFSEGFLLTRALMDWFRGHYCPDHGQRRAASPLLHDDHAGAAPTLIITAGFDPLRDEGQQYGEQLAAGGARVRHRCHGEQVHGFLGMTGGFRRAEAAVAQLCTDLIEELG